MLQSLLQSLVDQDMAGLEDFEVRVLVFNNGDEGECKAVVKEMKPKMPFKLIYKQGDLRGLSTIRQKIVDLSKDQDALVFIDDDETASTTWLKTLFDTWLRYDAHIVTGPVYGDLVEKAPWWVKRSRTFDTWKLYLTGEVVPKAYTNNVLISKSVFEKIKPAFDPDFNFIGSEDVHFFQRAVKDGFDIIWCQEAPVYEKIPQARMRFRWLARRSYNNGSGDTISRLKVVRGFYAYIQIMFLAAARFGSGILLGILGLLLLNLRFLVKGYRRLWSSIGTVAGIKGYIGEDYK
jgi:GT2 family glycosyltransferase